MEKTTTRSQTGSLPSQKMYHTTDEVDKGAGDQQFNFPTGARNWTQDHVDLLGVVLNRRPYDLNRNVMKVKPSTHWSPQMQNRMTRP
jgi:hypothetical protein